MCTESQVPREASRLRFNWRAFISVTTVLSFLAMSITGVVLFITPSGRVARWTGWKIWALTKEQWGGLHIWFSLIFMIAAVVHLYLNWRAFVSYFRSRIRTAFALRVEWMMALLLCGLVGWATLANVKPFSSLLIWNEAIKRSWETPVSQTPEPLDGSSSGQNNQGQQGGYGMGRLTLRQYCQQQNLDLEKAVQKLQEKGFKAEPDMTIREVATAGGVHPSALRDILQP